MVNKKQRLGRYGEEKAAELLVSRGYEIIEKNYRCKAGEIDIVASKDKHLVFIEVKTRSTTTYGTPGEAITRNKQLQISRCAQWYMSEHGVFDSDARFDVVTVMVADGKSCAIDIIENAFELSSK